jgi:sodium transport system permease protein
MKRYLTQTLVVMGKELRDSSRDRRAIFAIVFGVLVGPAVIVLMVHFIAERQRRAEEIRIPIVGAEHAPALIAWLQSQGGVETTPGPADPERAVRDGEEPVVVVIDKEFPDRFRSSRAATVSMVIDSSRDDARPEVTRVRELLQAYNAEIGALRLIVRGVSPEVAAAIRLEEIEVSTPEQRAAIILNFLGLFMLISALSGSMQLAGDTTAGERERGSLEPLLVNPVPRGALVLGKWMAASAAGLLAVALTMIFSVLLLKRVVAPDDTIRVVVGTRQYVAMAIAALTLCPLAAALQAAVGTFSRSFKEAQSYMGILMTLPLMAIGLIGALFPLTGQSWVYLVPLLSQYMLVTRVIAGEHPGNYAFAASAATSWLIIALLLALMTRMFRSERIIFAR